MKHLSSLGYILLNVFSAVRVEILVLLDHNLPDQF